MGNTLILTAIQDPAAVDLAEGMLPFDNLSVHEVEAYWRAFYDYATSFALSQAQFRTICCSAARTLRSQGSTTRATSDADRAFDLFARRVPTAQLTRRADIAVESVFDALEFYSSIAFIAAIPQDDKVDLLFDSWDMSEDGELDLDEFTISLKSTLCGLAKILQLRDSIPSDYHVRGGTDSVNFRRDGDVTLDEDALITLAGSIFRDIQGGGLPSSSTASINCEQFREYCATNQRAKAIFELFDRVAGKLDADGDVASDFGWTHKGSADTDDKKARQDADPTLMIASSTDPGDEFLAVKPWKGAIVYPTKPPVVSREAPAVSIQLDWIHGYSSQDKCANNLRYATTAKSCVSGRPNEIIYPAAAVCVVLDIKAMKQRHLLAHTDDVLSICTHPSLPIAASGEIGKQPKAIVWDIETTEVKCVLYGFHQRGVLLIAFQSADTLITVGGDEDHSIVIYESKDSWRSATLKITSKGNKAVPFSLATQSMTGSSSLTKQFVICGQKFIDFWTVENGALTSKKGLLGRKGTQQLFLVAEYLLKSGGLVVGTNDGMLYLFPGRELASSVPAHKGAVISLYSAGGGGGLLSGGKDGQIIMWDDNLKQVGGPFSISDSIAGSPQSPCSLFVRSCCFSPDKRTILVGTQASEIYELDARTGKGVHSGALVSGHYMGELWGLSVHPNQQQCCTVGDDQTLRIWDLATHKELRSVHLDCPARACAYSSDGKLIAVGLGSSEGDRPRPAATKRGDKSASSDSKRERPKGGFVVYSEANLVKVKDPCYDPKKWVGDLKFSPDDRTLAVASHDAKVYFYDVLNGFVRRHVFKKHSSYITHVDFSSDGNYLQSTCGAYELLFTDVKSGAHMTAAATFRDERWHTMTSTLGWSVQGIWEPESDGTDVNAVDRSKNGKFLASGDDFGKVKVFSYPCAIEKASYVELCGHSSHVANVRWSADDVYIVSVGGNDRCVFVWKHNKQPNSSFEIVQQPSIEPQPDDVVQSAKIMSRAFDSEDFEEDVGDEFMAVKPWLGAIVPPTNAKALPSSSSSPDARLELEHIHGYQSQNAANNARYDGSGNVIYHAAAVGIVVDKSPQGGRQRFFMGHDDDIVALCAHPNGKTFGTAQMGKRPKIFVWNSDNCAAAAPCLEGFHQRSVPAICFSSDGSKLGSVGGDDDHSIAIYSWQNGILVCSAKGERNNVRSICHHAKTQEWVTCGDRHIRFWKEQGKNMTSKKATFGIVAQKNGSLPSAFECAVSFGSAVVVAGSNGTLYVFDGSNEVSRSVEAHPGGVFALSVTDSGRGGDGGELISGGKDAKVIIWSSQFAKLVTISVNEVPPLSSTAMLLNPVVRSVHAANRSSRLLLVGTLGSDLIEIDTGNSSRAAMRVVTQGHYHMELWGLAVHQTKPEYCTVGDDQTIRVWNAETQTLLRMKRIRGQARSCAVSPAADVVAVGYGGRHNPKAAKTADQSGTIELLDYNDLSKSVFQDKPSKQAISELKFSPNGSTLAVGSHDRCIYLYRVQGKYPDLKITKTTTFSKHQSYITHLDFSSDGEIIQSNCGAYELLFSQAATGRHLTSASSVRDVDWATWTCVLGWPVQGIWPPCSDGTDVNAVARCSKKELLVAGDDFGHVKLYRYPCVVKNASGIEFNGHSSHVTNVRWCNRDKHVISTGGLDRCIMQWKVLRDHAEDVAVTEPMNLDDQPAQPFVGSNVDEMDEPAGDEFMAVKPWIGAIVAPSNAPVPNAREPDVRVELEWVYGYQSELARQNVVYNQLGEIVYHTAAVGVIYDPKSSFQKHHIGHTDDIVSFAVGGANRALVATGERGKKPSIRVWDSHTGELKAELKGAHSRAVLSVAFSPDLTRLVSVGADDNHSVALWEDSSSGCWTTPRLAAAVKGDRGVNMFAGFGSTRDAFVTGGVNHVLFWTIQGSSNITASRGRVGKQGSLQQFASGCAFGSADEFVTATAGGELYVWKGNQLIRTVKAHDGDVRVVSECTYTDPRGQAISVLLSGGKDGRVIMWNTSYQTLKSFNVADVGGHWQCLRKAINSVFLSGDGSKLLVGTCSSDIFELDVATGAMSISGPQPVVSGHFAMELWGLAVHPSRRQFVTTGDDATLRVWDMDTRRLVQMIRLPTKARACAYSADGELMAIGFGGDNGVRRRAPKAKAAAGETKMQDGGFSVLSARDMGVYAPIFEDTPAKEWISDVKFSPCGQHVAIGSHDNSVYLYSADSSGGRVSMTKRRPFSKHNSYITHLDFSHDSRYLQSNCGAYEYLFCDTATSEQVKSASALKDAQWHTWTCTLGWPVQGIWPACADGTDVNSVCASAARTLLAAGDDAGLVKLFRYPCVLKGSQFVACRGHSSHVANVRFSCDDKYVLSVGGNDRSIFQWKLS